MLDATDADALPAGCVVEVRLRPGQLLLLAATVLFGVRGDRHGISQALYISAQTTPSKAAHRPAPRLPPPAWLEKLSPAQQALVAPRLTGAPAVALSDTVELVDDGSGGGDVNGSAGQSAQAEWPDESEQMERWFFDLTGYLVVPGVIDAQWLSEIHAAIEAGRHVRELQVEVPESLLADNQWIWPTGTSQRLRGQKLVGRRRLCGLYDRLPGEHSAAFHKLIGNLTQPMMPHAR